jgi:hypothetical protein
MGNSRLTCNNVDVLIHYYTSPEEHPRKQSPAVQATIAMYLRDGIFESRSEKQTHVQSSYQLTAKGLAFLDLILSTPYPILMWSDPRTGERI